MKSFELNSESLRSIHKLTGMDAMSIAHADVSVIDTNIEKKIGSVLKPAFSIGSLTSRGSVYLMFKRFFSKEEIDSRLDKIKP